MVAVALGAVLLPARASAELGFGIQVEPTDDASPGQLAANRELWFATAPRATATRAIRIISTSADPQIISLGIFPLVVVDGKDTLVSDEPSEIAPWVSIEPNGFTLGPRAQQTVQIRITPPDGSEGTYSAYVTVSAKAPSVDPALDTGGTKAIVPTALSFSKSLWLGVGSGELLETDFELRGVAARRDGETKYLQVQIENTGGTPIRPKGDVEVVDPVFPDNRFGPLDFSFATILPGETGRTEFEAPAELEDGRWRVRVVARQGSVQKSEIYDVDLTFDDSTSEFLGGWGRRLAAPLFRFGLPLLALLGLLLGWRLLRRRSVDDPPPAPDDPPPAPDDPPPAPDDPPPAPDDPPPAPVEPPPAPVEPPPAPVEPPAPPARIVVHITGAVRSPGMFEVDADARVGEVIERAGGLSLVADADGINLARKVVDGEQLVVPKRIASRDRVSATATSDLLDLNGASAAQLGALPGIGPDLALAIVAHRRRIGRFTSVDQLREVKGIGPQKFATVKRLVRV